MEGADDSEGKVGARHCDGNMRAAPSVPGDVEDHGHRRQAAELPDGTAIGIRSLGPQDLFRLERFFWTLSPTTVYRRFMSPYPRPPAALARRLLDVDHEAREALGAFHGSELIGVARYMRDMTDGSYEIAVVVADAWHRHGIARLLLTRLGQLAGERGIHVLKGVMLAENDAAKDMLSAIFPGTTYTWDGSQVEAEIPLPG